MKYRIIHIDAGRKFIRKDVLDRYVDLASECGFNQIELYFSDNQGFRLQLDDMTVKAGGEMYDLSPALGDGYVDVENNMRPDGTGKYLTEREVTEIIDRAASLGVDIVPALDTPGHMGAILEAFPQFRYNGSKSCLNVSDADARTFGIAITAKYARFFSKCGCKYYNILADDVGGIDNYADLMSYINETIAVVKSFGLTPRVFNDALYLDEETGAIPPDTEVCYAFKSPVPPKAIAEKGHAVINAAPFLFWVLGKPDWQLHLDTPESLHVHKLEGGMLHDLAGAMTCLWCDVADAATDEEMFRSVEPMLRVFSKNKGLYD